MSIHRSSRQGLLTLVAAGAVLLGLSQCTSSSDSTGVAGQETVVTTESSTESSTAATTTTTILAPTTVARTTVAPTTVAPTTLPSGPDLGCAPTGSSAAVDRVAQRAWLCEDGRTVKDFPITSAWSMPDPGEYPIYAKDLHASSTFGGHYSTMTHFIAFSYGKNTGARVAFHSVPVLTNGQFVQPLDSVGTLVRRGDSSGCIRVLPDDAVMLWDALDVGDVVTVLT